MEKTIALAILVALLTLLTVRANTPPAFVETIREIAEKPIAWFAQAPQANSAWQAVSDTVPPPVKRQRIVREDDNQHVEMELEDGKVTKLKIDGQEINANEYGQHEKLIKGLREDAVAPTPPSPPTPQHGIWVTPPYPTAPRAPFPPRHSSSRISTETGDDGTTIINVERNGEPIKIRVKDGEVWVEDEKIEDGETMDIQVLEEAPNMFWNDGTNQLRFEGNRLHFNKGEDMIFEVPEPGEAPHLFRIDKDGNNYIFKGENGFVFEMPEMEIDADEMQRIQKEAFKNMKEQRKELEKQMKEMQKDQKEMSKEQKVQYKAMLDAQRALEKAHMAQERRQERTVRDNILSTNQDHQPVLRLQNRTKSFSGSVQDALVKDKLINDPDNYSFDLSKKDMRVNGKKQPKAVHEKYLKIYRKLSGKEIDNEKVKIRVRN